MSNKDGNPNRPSAGKSRRIPRWLFASWFLVLLCASHARPQSMESDWKSFFPRNTSECGFIDLTRATSFHSYSEARWQLVPASLKRLEGFLNLPLMGGSQVDRVLWAVSSTSDGAPHSQESLDPNQAEPSTEGTIGLLFGTFHPETALAFLNSRRVPSEQIDGYTAYPVVDFNQDPAYGPPPPPGGVWLIYLNPSTIAFGPRRLLAKMIALHEGDGADLTENDSMMALIDNVESDSMFWGVFDADTGRALIRQFIPNVTRPDAAALLAKSAALRLNIDGSFNPTLEIDLRTGADSLSTASKLSQLLATAARERYEALRQLDPYLAKLLNAADIYSVGSDVAVTITIDDRELYRFLDSTRLP